MHVKLVNKRGKTTPTGYPVIRNVRNRSEEKEEQETTTKTTWDMSKFWKKKKTSEKKENIAHSVK